MIGSSAFAADGAFAPGKPAGVKSAQDFNHGTLLIGLGAAAVIAAVAIVVSNQSGDKTGAPTTFARPRRPRKSASVPYSEKARHPLDGGLFAILGPSPCLKFGCRLTFCVSVHATMRPAARQGKSFG